MIDSIEREASGLRGLPRSAIHDLRTPLTSIRGYAQLLLRGVRSEEQARRAHETIFREAERLGRMFDQLSKVAEASLGQSRTAMVRFDLAQVVDHAVEDARARWPEHTFEYVMAEPATVQTDPRCVQEALAAILDNAAGFSEAGSRVRVSVELEDGRARISIADEGIGIPTDELERVFDCFSRATNVASAPIVACRGLGVGLFVAQSAATAAGGSLSIESEPDVGSTAHLALPLAD